MKTQWRDPDGVTHVVSPERFFFGCRTRCSISVERYFLGKYYLPHMTRQPPTCVACIANMWHFLTWPKVKGLHDR